MALVKLQCFPWLLNLWESWLGYLEISLTSNSSLRITVVFSAIHADPSRISRARAFPRSWMGSPNVFIRSALACLALMMRDDEYFAVFQSKRPTCSIASWASATRKLSVSVLIVGSYLIKRWRVTGAETQCHLLCPWFSLLNEWTHVCERQQMAVIPKERIIYWREPSIRTRYLL